VLAPYLVLVCLLLVFLLLAGAELVYEHECFLQAGLISFRVKLVSSQKESLAKKERRFIKKKPVHESPLFPFMKSQPTFVLVLCLRVLQAKFPFSHGRLAPKMQRHENPIQVFKFEKAVRRSEMSQA